MRGVDCFVATLLAMTVSRRTHTPAVIVRLDRAIQYSRDVCDKIEKPRRTGYPAGACHRARRKRDPVAGYDGLLCSSASAPFAEATKPSRVVARYAAAKHPEIVCPTDLLRQQHRVRAVHGLGAVDHGLLQRCGLHRNVFGKEPRQRDIA